MRRRGWTLFELLVVTALLAVVTAGAAFTLRSPLSNGRVRSQIDAVLTIDRTARSHARRFHRPARLEFRWDAAPPTLTVMHEGTGQTQGTVRQVEPLLDVRVARGGEAIRQTSVPIDAAGRSPTYAMTFQWPGGDETQVLIAGETGQPIFEMTEQDVDELWKLLEAPDPTP